MREKAMDIGGPYMDIRYPCFFISLIKRPVSPPIAAACMEIRQINNEIAEFRPLREFHACEIAQEAYFRPKMARFEAASRC
jgi:hypothetical protein